jgi:hypothetical protein
MRRAVLCALLAAALTAVASPTADAARGALLGLQDDSWLVHGPGTLDQRLDKLDALGVGLVRFNLVWSSVAPKKPRVQRNPADAAYRWGTADAVLQGLRARGIVPLVTLVGTPRWANGGRRPNWAPLRKTPFANFAYAAAKRYPFVRRWEIWNEPNQRRWLRPTSARLYTTRLLNPAYRAIHQANRRAKVGGGATAPRASKGGVSPVAWIREMGRAHARLDAYAHHPYPLSRFETPTSGGCARCSTITMATLGKLLRDTTRAFGPKRLWLTEYGYQTNPPDRFLGVSYRKQARYLGIAARKAVRSPRVDMLVFYLYRDDTALGGFQSGLERADGTPKPALAAFRRAMARYG